MDELIAAAVKFGDAWRHEMKEMEREAVKEMAAALETIQPEDYSFTYGEEGSEAGLFRAEALIKSARIMVELYASGDEDGVGPRTWDWVWAWSRLIHAKWCFLSQRVEGGWLTFEYEFSK